MNQGPPGTGRTPQGDSGGRGRLAPPAVPFETYAQEDAEQALTLAENIAVLVKGEFEKAS
jgi:HEPN domain-containing protein